LIGWESCLAPGGDLRAVCWAAKYWRAGATISPNSLSCSPIKFNLGCMQTLEVAEFFENVQCDERGEIRSPTLG